MKYYYSTVDEIVLSHSELHETNGQHCVLVWFERPNEKGFDFAETSLPNCVFTKSYGFSEDELFYLSSYLKNNAMLIWDFAQKGGGVNA